MEIWYPAIKTNLHPSASKCEKTSKGPKRLTDNKAFNNKLLTEAAAAAPKATQNCQLGGDCRTVPNRNAKQADTTRTIHTTGMTTNSDRGAGRGGALERKLLENYSMSTGTTGLRRGAQVPTTSQTWNPLTSCHRRCTTAQAVPKMIAENAPTTGTNCQGRNNTLKQKCWDRKYQRDTILARVGFVG